MHRGWLPKSAFNPRFYMHLKSFCRTGHHVASTKNGTLLSQRDRTSAWWDTRLWVRELYPVFMHNIAWRGWYLAGNHYHGISHRFVLLRHAIQRLFPQTSFHLQGAPPYVSDSRENPRRSTDRCHSTLLRIPLNLTIALPAIALSRFWRSCRSFSLRGAWRAPKSLYWTRDTTLMHVHSPLRAELPTVFCMYHFMYECLYVCMYACMYVCIY